MKAWVLDQQRPIGEHPLTLGEVPTPRLRGCEVRVRVSVCGICRTDLHVAEGDLPLGKPQLILGHEIVGVVDEVGEKVTMVGVGEKVGVSWLGRTCGRCRHCRAGRENYCANFQATGRDLDGGFAEYTVTHENAVYSLDGIRLPDSEIAPLLCPGVAGHCALRLANVDAGDRLGLFGFGPTAFYVLKVARHLGIEVIVSSRSEHHLARSLRHGAIWAGNATEEPLPVELDAAIVFPPAGPLVEASLRLVRVGGVVVLAPVSMSTLEVKDYSNNLWGRDIRTLYNVNRSDSEELLRLARRIDMSAGVEVFPLEACQDAMIRLRQGEIQQPNAVVRIREEEPREPRP
jgi:propanol-preferring alcohol dehydrogenase